MYLRVCPQLFWISFNYYINIISRSGSPKMKILICFCLKKKKMHFIDFLTANIQTVRSRLICEDTKSVLSSSQVFIPSMCRVCLCQEVSHLIFFACLVYMSDFCIFKLPQQVLCLIKQGPQL
jgi:hypothetical protein